MPEDQTFPADSPPGSGQPVVRLPRRRSGMPSGLLTAAIAGGALLVGAVGALALSGGEEGDPGNRTAAETAVTRTISGTFALIAYNQSCNGDGGYSDIRPGTAVVVYNGAGNIIGTGQLDDGEVRKVSSFVAGCTFNFSVPNVPDSDFYKVEVSHRGGITYSRADLESRLWDVATSLGDGS